MNKRPFITAGTLLGMMLAALEITVVATTGPLIVKDLGGFDNYSLLFSLYLLASFIGMPVWGKLSDHFGRKVVFVACMSLFLLGSTLCGLSTKFDHLLYGRFIQGLGGGGLIPLAFTILTDVYEIKSRTKVQGIVSGIWGMCGVIGPFIGGLLAETFGWRFVFYINIPPGFIAMVLVIKYLDVIHEKTPFALSLPRTLIKSRLFLLTCLTGFFSSAVVIGLASFIPLLYQTIWDYSATASGLVLLPLTLAGNVASIVSARLMLVFPYRTLLFVGFGLTVIGLTVFNLNFFHLGPTLTIATMTIMGIGLAFNFPIVLIATQYSVPKDVIGLSTALIFWVRTLGSTVVTAAMGGLLSHNLKDKLPQLNDKFKDMATLLAQNTDNLLKPEFLAIIKTTEPLRNLLHASLWPLFLLLLVTACVNLLALPFFPKKSVD